MTEVSGHPNHHGLAHVDDTGTEPLPWAIGDWFYFTGQIRFTEKSRFRYQIAIKWHHFPMPNRDRFTNAYILKRDFDEANDARNSARNPLDVPKVSSAVMNSRAMRGFAS